jgi:hypothetical protein
MLTMSKINEIREAFGLGKKIYQIVRELKIDKKTVRKYPKQNNFFPHVDRT